ncbi:MAG: site-specific DNA-methyltransferase [Elusimicrobiales bacterium]|nr:site-specific DNA-methyltransferase [Elusimicrobiales bacterium]
MTTTIYNTDCIKGMADKLAENSVDLVVTSIPFGALFMYSGKNEDIGNNHDDAEFMDWSNFGLHMRFWTEQLLRVMKPGCNVCIHVQQLLKYKNQHGYMGRRDFRGAVINIMERGGFEWKGEVAIPKNPQAMAQRMNLHCLLFITGKKNARQLAMAMNDYVLIFQKPGECANPVPAIRDEKINPAGWLTTEDWIKWARGVWDDVHETDVLDGYRSARESDQEKHVCPLQLEVIRRCMLLYSNPGELVLDPFMGIGSVAFVAVQNKRNAVGFELKESYYQQCLANIAKAERDLLDDAPLLNLCKESEK